LAFGPFWVAVCISFDFSGGTARPEARLGGGLYDTHHFLHAKLHLTPDPTAQARVGATDPVRPLSPFRQFMECRR
jgi:hypothetical protein